MNQIAPEFWEALSALAKRGENYPVKAPFAEVCVRLLAGVAPTGERCFLIMLPDGERAAEDSRSRGLRVNTLEMEDGDGQRGIYTLVMCLDPNGHDAFDLIGRELAEALTRVSPAEAISRVLGKWRRFWGQASRRLLSREEQVGLVSELHFLARWLVPATGPAAAALRWRGPFRARHDFEWPGRSVEVKGVTTVSRFACRISSIDQLEPPATGDLLLFVLRLREEAGGSTNLPMLISECRNALNADPDSVGVFETALLQTGYSSADDAEYAQHRWRVVEERLYAVDDKFPRFRTRQLSGEIPPAVSEISYTLDLAAIGAKFMSQPEEAAGALR